ncbi:MAG: segregation/condensation protein A [Armatimonadota bacterium]|nr:segregation/condensation protein A [Armatimonadota bacterium]
MPVSAVPAASLPPVVLPAFEGPLDLLLHLIREHRVDIADIPIVQITDQYLAYLRAMEAMNLNVAGEFLLMAATLLEIKSRMLLPKPPRVEEAEEGDDPRAELIQRLEDYQRYKAFIETLAEWEDDRRALFFRGQADYGGLYELPVGFGDLHPGALLKALNRMLAEAGDDGGEAVTSVRRQKITLRLAMAALWRKVQRGGVDGILLEECFERPFVRLEIVMTFLALLELLRQGRVGARQDALMGQIHLYAPEAVVHA